MFGQLRVSQGVMDHSASKFSGFKHCFKIIWVHYDVAVVVLSYEKHFFGLKPNRPFSYSEKESQSNDTLLHFVEFSNAHNSDRSSNATRSNLVHNNV